MDNCDRREFIAKGARATAVASICLCGLNGCATYSGVGRTPDVDAASYTLRDDILSIDLSKEPNLSKIGGAVKIVRADLPEGLIVAHVEEDRFEVVSLLCTHRGVEVEYDHGRTNFRCASIGSSVFTIDGQNVSGPASTPLREYEATLANRVLSIRLRESV
ncbi:MAG TPA: hypothetical protein EYH07_18185 [Kiloniellaceae bacterium]|nr:hypothetical protein [Kiloniellaceae bacterium]